MSNDKNILDDFLKSSLTGLEGDVSFADWDAIESQLDTATSKRPVAWYWTAAAVVVIGLGSFLAWNTLKDKTTQQDEVPSPELVVEQGKAMDQPETESTESLDMGGAADKGSSSTSEDFSASETNTQSSITPHSSESHRSGEMNALTAEAVNILPTKNVDNMPVDSVSKGDRIPGFSTVEPEQGEEIVKNEIQDEQYKALEQVTEDKTDSEDIPQTETPEGEQEPGTEPSKGGWNIGLHASPNWASKLIQDNGIHAWKINPKYKDYIGTMESGSFSYQLQARIDKDLRHNFHIGTGLNYNQIQEAVSYDYIVDGYYVEQVQQRELTFVPWAPSLHYQVQHSGTNTYHYIEVPVRVGWSTDVLNDKFNIKMETSVRYMYLAGMQGKRLGVTDFRALEDLSADSDAFNRSNIGLTANVGLYYKATEAWSFGIVPFYGRSLTSIRTQEAGIKEKPYNTGVNLGLHYKLITK